MKTNSFLVARRFASNIVKRMNLVPPIEPEDVISSYGIEIACCDNQYGIEAFSELNLNPKIYIDNKVSLLPRRRFTLAHELGHIIIPWHNGDIKCNTDKPYIVLAGRKKLDTQELEANMFASELLMPSDWVRSFFGDEDEGIDLQLLIEEIAVKANTSTMACMYALENALPSGHVFFVKSENFNYWKKFSSARTATMHVYYDKDEEFELLNEVCEKKRTFDVGRYSVIHYKLNACPKCDKIGEGLSFSMDDLIERIYSFTNGRIVGLLFSYNYILQTCGKSVAFFCQKKIV